MSYSDLIMAAPDNGSNMQSLTDEGWVYLQKGANILHRPPPGTLITAADDGFYKVNLPDAASNTQYYKHTRFFIKWRD